MMDTVWGELAKSGLPVLLMGVGIWWLAGRLNKTEENQLKADETRRLAETKERETLLEMMKERIKTDLQVAASLESVRAELNNLKTLLDQYLRQR